MNRYDKVMSKINVTPEMHDRIMKNIRETDFQTEPKRIIFFSHYKKYLSIAACLMVCIAGMLFVPNLINVDQEPPVQVVPDITTYSSKDELAAHVDFEVKEVHDIPFKVEQVEYTAYGKTMAQISYQGDENRMTFRMSTMDGDISGDYTQYEEEKNYALDGYNIALSGNNGRYELAVWRDGEFSYALQMDIGVAEDTMLQMIQSVK